ncbi:hypothetical protein XELAEV_18027844mg [Xenopus laevis]|uniref:Protein kinase domain-containing protein n=1 Tax=Xenopus laevis TaxID=8355 RepID=A0A974HKL6_XENLA|nr:hypothetical protein XELAEV_18027844mg [Xenopus laevis]
MAMEYCGGGTLYDLVQSRCGKPMSEKWIAYFCRETLKGLNSLHKHRIVHRDVKGVNIMLTDKAKVKLVDFGLCAQLDHKPDKSKDCKTLPSKCIDCWLNSDGEYDFKGDIWSLGVTAVELADGNPPLPYIPESAAIDKILTNSSNLPWSKNFQSFLEECLRYNPDHRASAKELLRHSFLQGLPPDKEIRQEIMDYLQKIQRKKVDKGAAQAEQLAKAANPALKNTQLKRRKQR